MRDSKRVVCAVDAINERGQLLMAKGLVRVRTGVAWFKEGKGQGTTEYAILVGVLVVIAILAITVFRPKLQELWDAIATGINGL